MESAAANAPPLSLETTIGQIRVFLQGRRWDDAIAAAHEALEAVPTNRDLLYMLAVGQRYSHRIPQALTTLERLEAFHPRYPRLFQERGHCHVTQRDAAAAIAAFEKAVHLNPALPASWSTLETLYRMTGRPADSANAAKNVANLKSMLPELVTAYSMYADGELYQSEQLVRRYLLEHGDDVEGMRLLAKLGIEQDILDDAEFLLESALEMAPDHHVARFDFVVALLKQHKHPQAQKEIEKLLALDPDNRVCRTTQATIWLGLGQVDRAIRAYRQLLRETPHDPELHLSIGHALKTRGVQAEAIEAYREAARLQPRFGEAYWSLANLKTYRFTDEELDRMRTHESDPTIQMADRYHLCFALGKALEDRAEYAESFSYYERGNALKKRECRYRPGPIERNTRLQKAVCTREFFASRSGVGCKSNAPIFIVGLPRSGSTLLEQILASHSQVEGTMELAEIPRLAGSLQGRYLNEETGEPPYPGILAQLTPDDFLRYGERYLADSRSYRGEKPRFIDKMPNNFRHLGLIHLILPNAKIIDARREPMACCFSNFKQLFASGQQFTYSIEDITRYYKTYLELMDHWDAALPGKILRVQHEDVVDDLETHVRRILDFCELEFEPACLDFHKTERRVHTASSEQVRRPINREGLDQWRHYEPWLESLRHALADVSTGPQRDVPESTSPAHDYAQVLVERHEYSQARDQLDRLLKSDPDNRQFRALYATVCIGLGEQENAIALYRGLLDGAAAAWDLHLSIAHALKTLGRQSEAIESYRAAAAARANFGDAYWSLANLKTYRFLDEEIARMRAGVDAPATQPVDRYHLCFALGKAHEDRGEYEKSWRCYERGNALKRSEIRYRPAITENNTRKQIEVCTRDFFAARAGLGAPSPDPIFIVGLPRAGSTLIEQILASHSLVEGTKELAEIPRLVQLLNGRESDDSAPRYPGALNEVTAEQFTRFGEKFIADTLVYRKGKPFFVDKMPNNFRHLGLIHLILPRAKIIDARREPMACCFSNFKQLFANGQEFTYGLEDIARYYRNYVELMEHWDAVLPGKVLRVQHEEVVEDLDGNVRRILDFCGLPFEQSCLEFHRTERSIRTASSEQVRRPIFKEGLDQWRHFERWLGPLKTALGAALNVT